MFSPVKSFKSANEKTAIAGGFLKNFGFAFSFERLPLLHRRWAGIAKVKIKEKVGEGHVIQ
jgi:hypothetical protein